MLPAERDPYELLGVPPNSDQEAIKRAFRLFARRFHPDISDDPEAERKFREAAEAYRALSEPGSRRRADLVYGARRARTRGRSHMEEAALSRLSRDELFELWDLTRRQRRRGADVLVSVPVDAYEAERGTIKSVALTTEQRCRACRGSGAGEGERCEACGGRRTTASTKVLQVTIPSRATDGERIRIPGEGHSGGAGGDPGDAYVSVCVAEASDAPLARYASFVGLVLALAFLAYLLLSG